MEEWRLLVAPIVLVAKVHGCGLRNVFRVNEQVLDMQRRLTAAFDPSTDGKVGWGGATYNVVNILVGTGLVTVPYGFNCAGWAAAGVIVVTSIALALTGWLLGATLEATADVFSRQAVEEESRDFAALALLASGPRARDLISSIFAMELLGGGVTQTIIIGVNASLITGLPTSALIIGSALLSFVLMYASMRALAYVSAASCLAAAIAAGGVAWGGLRMPVELAASHAMLHARGLPHVFGIVVNAFAGHPCLPSVYWSMRDRSQYPSACFVGFLISMTFFGSVSCLSYYFYGSALQRVLTDNIGRDLSGNPVPGLYAVRLLAAAAFVIKMQGGLPLLVGPVATSLENTLGVQPEQSGRKGAVKVLMLMVMALLALFFRDALDVFSSIAGAALTATTSVVFPVWVYWRLGPVHGRLMRTTLIGTMVAGIAFAVYGTIDGVRSFRV